MAARVGYQRLLVRAVDLFLERTPSASARAQRIVEKCRAAEKPFSLDSLKWGDVISELSDSEFTNDITYLSNLRQHLMSQEGEWARWYLWNYDFRDDLSIYETRWLAQLQALTAFLGNFPHADAESAVQQYQSMVADVRREAHDVPPVVEGDQTIFHVILEEVTGVITNFHLDMSLRLYHYLVPSAPYSHIGSDHAPPDASDTLIWAQKALDAISGKAGLLITWRKHAPTMCVSLH